MSKKQYNFGSLAEDEITEIPTAETSGEMIVENVVYGETAPETPAEVNEETPAEIADINSETPANSAAVEAEHRDKKAAFKKLAEARTTKILLQFESLGKLSSSAYSYTPEQITEMFEIIKESLDDCQKKFQPKNSGSTGRAFKFSE